jgi:dolichol-phosphate mannosyltransferase
MLMTTLPMVRPPKFVNWPKAIHGSAAYSGSADAAFLSTAVIEGMLASTAPYLAVIDADLQHDEKLLPQMLAALKSDDLDIVIGSRYVLGGAIGTWDKRRAGMSAIATRLARLVVSAQIADPMSGFFMLHRPAFERAMRQLSGHGFKILLDLFASTPTPYRFKELPYVFGERLRGESKLDGLVVWEHLMLLLSKQIGRWVPVRFALFTVVGGTGIIVHLATLRLALISLSFPLAQTAATISAMTSNFLLNNILTNMSKFGLHYAGCLLTRRERDMSHKMVGFEALTIA